MNDDDGEQQEKGWSCGDGGQADQEMKAGEVSKEETPNAVWSLIRSGLSVTPELSIASIFSSAGWTEQMLEDYHRLEERSCKYSTFFSVPVQPSNHFREQNNTGSIYCLMAFCCYIWFNVLHFYV